MPAYCGSCPYNKFCKNEYFSNPTCPMGYSPVGKEGKEQKSATPSAVSYGSGHFYDPNILLKIGKAAVNKNDYETAVACYEKVLELEPTNNEANFLLKRTKFMIKGDTTDTDVSSQTTEDSQAEEKTRGMLQYQEVKRIQIKPKQQMDINPNIITSGKPENVYGVQTESSADAKLKENVSKTVAVRTKTNIMKSKKGIFIVISVVIAMILMIVVALWVFGFLDF